MRSARFAAFGLLLAGSIATQAQAETLLCRGKTANGEPIMDVVLTVDFSRKLVDGVPANFTETAIKWTRVRAEGGRITYTEHEVNRLSGQYSSYERGVMYAGPPPVYVCAKAPSAKF